MSLLVLVALMRPRPARSLVQSDNIKAGQYPVSVVEEVSTVAAGCFEEWEEEAEEEGGEEEEEEEEEEEVDIVVKVEVDVALVKEVTETEEAEEDEESWDIDLRSIGLGLVSVFLPKDVYPSS